MTEAIRHRGPDGASHFTVGNMALGNSRLAIIDINGGKQPLSNENDKIWITFNGEIYNYKDLRIELLGLGHLFKTNSDTETILHAYEEWSEDCVSHLRGMFAFVIADLNQRKFFLARDHLGIKPLYYLDIPGLFAFASELEALKVIPSLKLKLDLTAIDQYLCLRYIPDPLTGFKEIKKLPPAHHLTVSFDGKISSPKRYWQLRFSPDNRYSEEEWVDRLDHLLRESIEAHLVSDVPFGAFLSGGLDSSAVIAYMAKILPKPIKTFTIGFDEDAFSELEYAKIVSKTWETEHHFDVLKPQALKILPDIVRHYGEPFGDSSAIPTYYVSKLARRYVPMVLSGDGGDEVFAGYVRYEKWMRRGELLWNKLFRRKLKDWMVFTLCLWPSFRFKLWRPEYRSAVTEYSKGLEELFEGSGKYPDLQRAQFMDINTFLPFDILTKVDRASMFHGLEVRTPFVDLKVMEFIATIPGSIQLRRNEKGQFEGKLLFKKLLSRYYPGVFIHRRKMGFSVPLGKWLGEGDMFQKELHERLLGKNSSLLEYFDQQPIQWLIQENHSKNIWILLFLEEWLRQNKPLL